MQHETQNALRMPYSSLQIKVPQLCMSNTTCIYYVHIHA